VINFLYVYVPHGLQDSPRVWAQDASARGS